VDVRRTRNCRADDSDSESLCCIDEDAYRIASCAHESYEQVEETSENEAGADTRRRYPILADVESADGEDEVPRASLTWVRLANGRTRAKIDSDAYSIWVNKDLYERNS
jgi:hypothetical protein